MADRDFALVGYDVDPQKVEALNREAEGRRARGVGSMKELVAAVRVPRAIMMMVPAGPPVDAVIDALLPDLAPHDLLIDGGNSHFRETEARARRLASKQVLYMGVGISGGRGAPVWDRVSWREDRKPAMPECALCSRQLQPRWMENPVSLTWAPARPGIT